jgi:glycine/D-amino acid oxidase-like deaminating enzyme
MKVCVIGSGCSGLVTIKELLDEGHEVVCYEREQELGGNFRTGAVGRDSLRLTISQHTMSYSSFPPPASEPTTYWTRRQYLDYLHTFARHFDLNRRIRYGMQVDSIRRIEPSRYRVQATGPGGEATHEDFDAVAVCQGAHRATAPRVPEFEGREQFEGEVLHASQYEGPMQVVGKRVVCVGIGESAADILGEIANVAEEAWTTFRRWPSMTMRWDHRGFTGDALSVRASQKLPAKMRAKFLKSYFAELMKSDDPRVRLVAQWNHSDDDHIYKFLQKSDDFIPQILDGSLKVHPHGVARLGKRSVIFTDGTEIAADTVICCTGYQEGGPPSLIDGFKITNVRDMFKHFIHPELGPRVAFIGWARPAQGGVTVCSEMQARYFSMLCSGKRTLPAPAELHRIIEQDRATEEADFFVQSYLKTLVNYSVYLDSLARLVGCMPTLRDLASEPDLVWRFLFGSNVPNWYRVVGPHAQREQAVAVIRRMPVPFTPKMAARFTAINAKLWLEHRLAGTTPAYSLLR